MEYICLILQIAFLLGTIFLQTGDSYLVVFNKIHRKYLIFEIVIQILCLALNVIILFIFKKIMIYVLGLHIILMVLIKSYFDIKAKNIYFQELEDKLIEEKLLKYSSGEIRKYLLEKHKLVYSIKDIEKCLLKTNKQPKKS